VRTAGGAVLVVAFKPGPGQPMRRVFNPTTQGPFGVGPPTESNINTMAGGAEGIRTSDLRGAGGRSPEGGAWPGLQGL
jgi:hypothetical protein